jgi:hypothetical protein
LILQVSPNLNPKGLIASFLPKHLSKPAQALSPCFACFSKWNRIFASWGNGKLAECLSTN